MLQQQQLVTATRTAAYFVAAVADSSAAVAATTCAAAAAASGPDPDLQLPLRLLSQLPPRLQQQPVTLTPTRSIISG